MAYEYFYDAQMKRFLQQIVRGFSGVQYETGRTINGAPERRIVPCRTAVQNRMVAALMRNGSDNVLLTVPMITIARTGLVRDQKNDHNHSFRGTLQVAERAKDPVTGHYTGDRGQGFTIERLMPLPYEMTIQVDIWTSNLDQKDQILEQLLVIAGREVDIQNSDNPLDWSALTTMRLQDITLSSRSVQAGTEDEIDIATLTYTLPFFLNPPAKITRQVLIQEIRTNVDVGDQPIGQGSFVKSIVTPGDYHIAIERGTVTLIGSDDLPKPWTDLASDYRFELITGVAQMRLRKTGDPEAMEIVGTLYETDDPTKRDWQVDIDTLPANTLPPVNAIVRPLRSSPGNGLPAAANGQRYIIFDDISTTESWGSVNAHVNDIIQYNNGSWSVVTTPAMITTATLVNQMTGTQLRWNGKEWEKAIDGIYGPGYWRVLP